MRGKSIRASARGSIALLTCALALALPASASADFGFQDVNTGEPGVPDAPAFPATKAVWAGTCDLGSAGTSNGGIGTAPSVRAHCLDIGGSSLGYYQGATPWPPGQEPQWRLDPVKEAGSHPDGSFAFYLQYKGAGGFFTTAGGAPEESVKNIIVRLPPGVVGNPEALAKCGALAAQAVPPACPARAQVGLNSIGFPNTCPQGFGANCRELLSYPVYNIEARDTVTAEFLIGNVAAFFNVPITARGRTNGDYGVDTLALLIPEFVALGGQAFTFWGVPWANEHDKWRFDGADHSSTGLGSESSGPSRLQTGIPLAVQKSYDPSWGPIKPFFTQPTECSGEALPVGADIDSWVNPVFEGGSFVTENVVTDTIEGCDQLEFDPQMTLRPTVSVSDSPSGLDVKLEVPQNNDPPAEGLGNPNLAFDPDDATGAPAYWKTPAGRATAHLKDTVVKLPAGTSFNPAAANGLRGCTTAQIGLTSTSPKATFNNDPHQCPDTSKIGTLEIVSPLLPDPLKGDVYAAPQDDNPFPGTLTAIYLVAQDEERGLSVKLAGKIDLDPQTGQISSTFVDNPQLPFHTFELHFKTGPRAPLNTPATCGNFENAVDLIPWSFPDSGPQPTIHDPFPISQMPNGFGCVNEPEDRSFAPGFEAGTTTTQAGGDTNFVLNVTRRDGEQEISGISLDMAKGVVGNLSQTPYCPEAAIAAARARSGQEETASPSCPTASYIGKVNTLAGAGPLPLPTVGKLYLSGPYDPDGAGPKGTSPLSVTTIVPAIAGGVPGDPAFDLGNVVIRTGVNVDPRDATVHIDSTDVPYIVGGVPLRIRSVAVDLDKPSFMRNPTDCSELSLKGGIGGSADPLDKSDDVLASVSNRFQVGGCEALGFKPTLKLRLKGPTKRTGNPKLIATLTGRPGDANIANTQVTMPRSAFLDQAHIRTICTRVQFAARTCPEGSVYGFAEATTPLLADPIKGPVILRSSDNTLPDLIADMQGPDHQPIRIELSGRTDSFKGALRNTFDVTPDAPVTKFTLTLFGGNRGLIENSANICKGKHRATVKMGAQNGRRITLRPKLVNDCKKKRKRKGAKKRSR